WGLGFLGASLVWPAIWIDPLGTIRQTAEFVLDIGTTPHQPGNFFLGQPIVDPGPLFYPVAVALRLGPGTTLGLLALAVFSAIPARRPGSPHGGTASMQLPPAAGFLIVFVLLFWLGLTASPKKVDRYLLPLLPALDVLAAL